MRYKLVLSYDGASFHGFQRQINEETVQGKLEESLSIIFKNEIQIKSAGRTDAGVHALCQVVHFDSEQLIPVNNLKKVINKMIAPHIYVKDIEIVDESFHARHTPHIKEYRYLLSTNEFDPLKSNYIYFYQNKINLEKIKEVLNIYIGTHDFKTFSKGHEKENTIRTIELFEVNENDGLYEFIVRGNGFLHNMVRIMIAVALKVSEGKITTDDVKTIMEEQNRKKAPWCAPACGLYLYNISYNN